FFFQAEDGIRDFHVTGVQTCALPILAVPEQQEHAQHVDHEVRLLTGQLRLDLVELGFVVLDVPALKDLGPPQLLHAVVALAAPRSEEHTSELQSREKLVCRVPLETTK